MRLPETNVLMMGLFWFRQGSVWYNGESVNAKDCKDWEYARSKKQCKVNANDNVYALAA
jgi:hypothetical protein